jgi:hypothetical protein
MKKNKSRTLFNLIKRYGWIPMTITVLSIILFYNLKNIANIENADCRNLCDEINYNYSYWNDVDKECVCLNEVCEYYYIDNENLTFGVNCDLKEFRFKLITPNLNNPGMSAIIEND